MPARPAGPAVVVWAACDSGVMRYADRAVCPDCRSLTGAAGRCPSCGLDLTAPAVRTVWEALQAADAWLAVARAASDTGSAPVNLGPQPLAPEREPSEPRRLTVAAVMLGLGALCVLAAGTVFLIYQWAALGVWGRAGVMSAATAIAAVAGLAAIRRGLRASAEALFAVTFGLFTLDWFGARAEGLLGLDAVDSTIWLLAWVLTTVLLTGTVLRLAYRRMGVEIVTVSVVSGCMAAGAAHAVVTLVADHAPSAGEFWNVFGGLVAALAVALAQPLRARVGRVIARAVTAVMFVIATVPAVSRAFEHPALSDLATGDGWPLLAMAGLSFVAGQRLTRWRSAFWVLAGLELVLLVGIPVEQAWPRVGGHVVASLALVALATARAGGRIVPVATGLTAAGLVVSLAPWYGELFAQLGESAFVGADPFEPVRTGLAQPERWGIPLVAGAALAASLVLARRWRGGFDPGAWAVGLAALCAVAHVPVAVAAAGAPVLWLTVSVLLVAAVVALADLASPPQWAWVCVAFVGLTPVATAASAGLAMAAWLACAGLGGWLAWRHRVAAAGPVLAACSAWWFVVGAWPLGDALDLSARPAVLVLTVAALATLAGACAIRPRPLGVGVECAASFALVVAGCWAAATTSVTWMSLLALLAGVVYLAIGMIDDSRSIHLLAGSCLLLLSWVLRLIAWEVDAVEAYTGPFALGILAIGLVKMRDNAGLRSRWALGPGVALALMPSLPHVLDDPLSLRALLLGIAAAVALVTGVARQWQAPFVGGVLVLGVIAIVETWPTATTLPPWVLLATGGVLLLAIGSTWERRVSEGRAVIRYLSSMR